MIKIENVKLEKEENCVSTVYAEITAPLWWWDKFDGCVDHETVIPIISKIMVDGVDFHYRILSTEKDKRHGQESANRIRLRINGKNKNFNVAYLVAKAFLPNPDNLPYVCHANGDCTNDSVESLIWSEKKYIAKADQGKGRESFDLYVKGDTRPLACGIMALSGLWAVRRWERAMRDILDFERTYGVLTTKYGHAYLNGIDIEIKKTTNQ